jgi:hypothetical protein
MDKKLGVIVPYRDRYEQLIIFKKSIQDYLTSKNIKFELIIVEQDDAKIFNRGKLLNIGFLKAKELKCNYVVFHDVDMLPVDVDYSYSEVPLHLATDFLLNDNEKKRELFDEYFGGVTMFPIDTFKKINGYSNKYWAWGFEDDDLLLRCRKNNVNLDTLELKNFNIKTKALKFNGVDSFIKCNNTINTNSNATIFISFLPDNLILNHEKEFDEFTVFSIPGWDFSICYNSFSRYNFCTFDNLNNALYVNSNIKTNYKTNIVILLDMFEKTLKVYQDGIFIGQTEHFKKLRSYRTEPYFYLGVGKPDRELTPNYFRGYIDEFAYYDIALTEKEVEEISINRTGLLTENFDIHRSSSDLKIYYNANFIDSYQLTDLSGNKNNGEIIKCEIVNLNLTEYKEVKIPYRRKSLFKSLIHDENGFLDNKWKDQATRWNQLRYHNEISTNTDLTNEDGLNTLEFIEHGITNDKKITEINIGI